MEIQTTGEKSHEVKSLIFSILDLLRDVGIPLDGTSRRLERMAMACLAVGGVKNSFKEVKYALDCEMQIHIIYEYIADFRWHANSVKWAGERAPLRKRIAYPSEVLLRKDADGRLHPTMHD